MIEPVENSLEMIKRLENSMELIQYMVKTLETKINLMETKLAKIENSVEMVHSATRRLPTLDEFRKVVKEEIQSAKEGSLTGDNRTSTDIEAVTNERNLFLKFDEAPYNVLTGKEMKTEAGTPVTIAIYDEAEQQIVESGPGSSAKVEILFLKTGEDNSEHSLSHEDFNNRIIEESDKMKPRFARRCHVNLKRGRGSLSNAKLANGAEWTKKCKCQLGARIVDNLSGIKVQEALTEPFEVSDSRCQLYRKCHLPTLWDEVWRLDLIARDGIRYKRLKMNHILTVGDFLFLYFVNPSKLKKIIGPGDRAWKAIVNHAQSCVINDTEIRMYRDSSEPNMAVVFDVVGKLKAIIRNSQYVQYDHLSDNEKDRANKLLCSAFEHRDRITKHPDEMTLMQQFTQEASNASLNPDIQGSVPSDFNLAIGTSRQAETQECIFPGSKHPVGVNQEDRNFRLDNFFAWENSQFPLDSPMPIFINSNPAEEFGVENFGFDDLLFNSSVPTTNLDSADYDSDFSTLSQRSGIS